MTACVNYPRDKFDPEPGGGHRGRGYGYLQVFLTPFIDVGHLSGRGMPSKGSRTGQTLGKIHVSTFQGSSGNCTVGYGPFTTVPKLWHAHARSEDDSEPEKSGLTRVCRCGCVGAMWRYLRGQER